MQATQPCLTVLVGASATAIMTTSASRRLAISSTLITGTFWYAPVPSPESCPSSPQVSWQGNIKTKFGVKRERAPFVLTPDFVHVMDKKGADSTADSTADSMFLTPHCARVMLTGAARRQAVPAVCAHVRASILGASTARPGHHLALCHDVEHRHPRGQPSSCCPDPA